MSADRELRGGANVKGLQEENVPSDLMFTESTDGATLPYCCRRCVLQFIVSAAMNARTAAASLL